MNDKNTIDHEDIIDADVVEEETLRKRDRALSFVVKHGKTIALTTGAVVSAFTFGRLLERSELLEAIIDNDHDEDDDSEDEEFEEIEITEED